MSESTDVLLIVYIRTIHLKKTALIFFKNSQPCPKSLTQIKIEDQYVFRRDFKFRQEVNDEIKQVFLILKMSFKFPLKIIYLVKQESKKIILVA